MREWPQYDARVDITIAEGGSADAEGSIRVLTPSGTMLFDVKIPWQAYALAVLRHRGAAPGTVRVYAPELLGTEEERKTLQVRYDGHSNGPEGEAAKAAALKPFERDGWIGRPSDLGNMHRRGEPGLYLTEFRRHLLDGHPIEPVQSIPNVVLAAQHALKALNDKTLHPADRAMQAQALLDAALNGGDPAQLLTAWKEDV